LCKLALPGIAPAPSEGSCVSKLMMRALQPSLSAPPQNHAAPRFE